MNQREALQEAIAALGISETEFRRHAGESFISQSTKTYWLSSAERANEARNILFAMLVSGRQEGE